MNLENRKKHCALLMLLLALLSLGSAPAIATANMSTVDTDGAQVLLLSRIDEAVPLWPHLSVFETDGNSLKPQDLHSKRFIPLTRERLNPGVNQRTYWLRLTVKNDTASPRDWIAVPQTAYLDYLELYRAEQGRLVMSSSDLDEFQARRFAYRKLAVSDRLAPAASATYYLKLGMVRPDSISLGLTISNPEHFQQQLSREQFLYGLYFGACLTLMILTAILWGSIREAIYGVYLGYLAANTLLWALVSGYAFQYLLPGYPHLINAGFHIVYLLVVVTALQFSKQFLETAVLAPRVHRALSLIQCLALLAILLRFAGLYQEVLYAAYVGLALLVLLPLVGFYCYRKGMQFARWYILSWSVYALGILVSVSWASFSELSWIEDPLVFTQWISLLESFLLALALSDKIRQLTRDFEVATEESHHDALTGLGNRRLLQKRFEQLSMHASARKKLWLMLLDLDYFKAINDDYGHSVGDRVLQSFSEVLENTCRPGDIVIRYGGEEFVILLQAEQAVVVQVAERIRRAVQLRSTRVEQHSIDHTVSIGIAKVSKKPVNRLDKALDEADAALYFAKEAGRNRIAICRGGKNQLLDGDGVTSTGISP